MGKRLFEMFPDDPQDPIADGVRNLRASLERVKSQRTADVMAVQRYPIQRPAAQGATVGTGWPGSSHGSTDRWRPSPWDRSRDGLRPPRRVEGLASSTAESQPCATARSISKRRFGRL